MTLAITQTHQEYRCHGRCGIPVEGRSILIIFHLTFAIYVTVRLKQVQMPDKFLRISQYFYREIPTEVKGDRRILFYFFDHQYNSSFLCQKCEDC